MDRIEARGLRSALIPGIDQTNATGIVSFPGAMVGMLVAGAEPLEAVRLQRILLWSLLGSVTLAALIVVGLGYRGFARARTSYASRQRRSRQ